MNAETNKDTAILNSGIVLSIGWQIILVLIDIHSAIFEYDAFVKWLNERKKILLSTGHKEEEIDTVIDQLANILKYSKEEDEKRKLKDNESSI